MAMATDTAMAMATDGNRPAKSLSAMGLLAMGLFALGVAGATSAVAADADVGASRTGAVDAAGASTGVAATTETNNWRFVPDISVRETATDNVDQSADKRGDFITEIIPGIRIDGNGARVKLHLDYRMDNLIYARQSSKNNLQNALDANGSVEAIEKFLFIDGSANIAQQAISPLGPRPVDATTASSNRAETRAYQLSPYLRGQFGAASDYELRYRYSDLHSSSDAAGNSRVGEITAHVGSAPRVSGLGWRLEADSQTVASEFQRDTRSDRGRGILIYQIDPQFRVSATLGRERNDYVTLDTVDKTTYGAGFEWAPTSRTKIHGNWEERFFGGGWDFGASHRTPFFALSITDHRDVNTDAQGAAGVASGAAYDLLFAALTTRFPDPLVRADEAQRILRGGGIPADLGLPPDFLVGTAFIERRQQASAAFLGVRNTLTFIVYQLTRDALGASTELTAPAAATGFATNTRERGASATYTHRLTGFSSISAIGSWLQATSDSAHLASAGSLSRQWDGRLIYVTQFGPRTSGSLEYRYARFDSDSGGTFDYRENALIASVLLQF